MNSSIIYHVMRASAGIDYFNHCTLSLIIINFIIIVKLKVIISLVVSKNFYGSQ